MLSIDTIVVARDFSPVSKHVLRRAVILAANMEATLHVLHVYKTRKRDHPTRDLDTILEELGQSEMASQQSLESMSVFGAERQAVTVAPAIMRYARAEEADLIVLGTHGRSGMKRALLGSVAETVTRRADRAVLTVRATEAEPPASERIRRILVPVNFAEETSESTQVAMEWAALNDAQADLLYVAPTEEGGEAPPQGDTLSQELHGSDHEKTSSALSSTARSKLLEFAKEGKKFDVPVNLHVETGDVGSTIVEVAQARESDLVVMSTRGRTGVKRFVLGSVTETVVRNAPCPVLTVRTRGRSIRATPSE